MLEAVLVEWAHVLPEVVQQVYLVLAVGVVVEEPAVLSTVAQVLAEETLGQAAVLFLVPAVTLSQMQFSIYSCVPLSKLSSHS